MTDGRRAREDRATQPLDAGWLSFAIYESENDASKIVEKLLKCAFFG